MTPRYQKMLFVVLFAASVAMTAVLVRLRERAHDRLLQTAVSEGTTAPTVAPLEQVTLMVADDETSTLAPETIALPLPDDSQARARAVLNRLLSQYSGAHSQHPLPPVANPVEAVFLMPLRGASGESGRSADRIAIVNLSTQFAASHPSGLETETLTVLSISATLHANLPQVMEVRFLVGGEQQATLHGHADLTQTYLTAASAAASGAQP